MIPCLFLAGAYYDYDQLVICAIIYLASAFPTKLYAAQGQGPILLNTFSPCTCSSLMCGT